MYPSFRRYFCKYYQTVSHLFFCNFAGQNSNKMKKILFLLLSVLSILMCCPIHVKAQSLLTFTETYSNGVNPTTAQKAHWTNFKSQLTTHCYTQVHFYGSNNTTGFTVNNPADVATIASNINTGTSFQLASGGNNWQYCTDDLRINGPVVNYCSSCDNGNCLRPMNGYAGNWGGLNGSTCGASTQTITLEFTYNGTGTCGSISGPSDICQGQTGVGFSVTAVSGASSYTWSLPSGATITSGNNTNSITVDFSSSASSGTITVYATSSCGNGSSSPNFNLTVSSGVPSIPGSITGNAGVCANSSQTYSVSAVPGATDYSWTLPLGWTGSSTTTSISATAGSTGGTISVTANNGCGSSASQTLSVSATQAPSQPGSITGNAGVCANSSQTYSVSAVPGATDYSWTLPLGWTGSSATTSISATAGSAGGTISVTANNGCGNSAAQTLSVSTTQAPSQPGSITGNAGVCANSSQTYSVSAVPGATDYSWTLPLGWTGSSTTTSISATAGSTGGTISVTANNGCGNSAAQTLSVSTTQAPSQPGSITGNTNVCANSSQTYSVSVVPGATDYSWTLPLGWTGSSTTTSISATAGSTGGTISVTANNGCGSSAAETYTITINTVDVSVISTALSLTANASPASYQWVTCPLFQIINNATSQAYSPLLNGNYAVIVTQNGCTDTSLCYPIIITGLSNDLKNDDIIIYPNPATDHLTIEVNQNATIEISNTEGQLIKTFTSAAAKASIDISTLPCGVYIMQIKTANGVAVRKFIRE